MAKSRSDRTQKLMEQISENVPFIEELKEELQDWQDNIPENLQDGNKAQELDERIDELDTLIDDFNTAIETGREIIFPGMI